ncbi:MAG TPA: methionine--tRNA ligase [Polyangia bacterium]|nr:methionine--tRNA ligase [Polyangia bacterium]
MSRFYITTPIYYVSDVPHLGHAYTTIVCDALSRYHRMRGEPTRFLTGTDEHGQKIARLAEAHHVTPRAYADKFAEAYQATWRALEVANDDFIRTTDPDHEATVQEVWRRMNKSGAIYLADYEGWYCVACEQFYTEKELKGNDCPVHGRPVEKVKEQSFYFKLSQYRDRLLELYDKHPEFVQPDTRRNEVRAFVAGELRDLSISRTTFNWGVPVPDQDKHIIYVWLDALTNYYSATRRSDEAKQFWDQPDARIVHMIGKEIIRFHAVYWPAFLMAADLPLPTTVFAHGWWTVDGEKMSKTLGNVVDPLKLSQDIGVDAFRYFVLREVPLGSDGDFSHEALITRYNAELCNDLGNLLNRTLGMVSKYQFNAIANSGKALCNDVTNYSARFAEAMEALAPSKALEEIWRLVRRANEFIDKEAPWKQDRAGQERILGEVLEVCRALSHLTSPFMPERAAEMQRQLGLDEPPAMPAWSARTFTPAQAVPLFPRIDDDRKAQLLAHWTPKKETPAQREPRVTYAEFQKLDLRVGRVLAAEAVPKAKKLLKLTVDVGATGQRQVVAGIAETYRPEELVGKRVILLANLEPATIRGVLSEGMILAAGDDDVVALSGLDRDAPPGTKVR